MPPNGNMEATPVPMQDLGPMLDFLRGLCPVALGADIDVFGGQMDTPKNRATIEKFARDPDSPVLVINATSLEEGNEIFKFELMVSHQEYAAAVAFIKRHNEVVIADVPLYQQLLFFKITDQRPFEVLHKYIRSSFLPLIDSFHDSDNAAEESEHSQELPVIKRKVAELELSFRNLQEEADIPEVFLPIDPAIQELVNVEIKERHLIPEEDKVKLAEDEEVLDRLQNGVTVWICEIQKVTDKVVNKEKMDRQITSVSSEINYWLSLSRGLDDISERTRERGLELTLEVLKLARRYHVTVGFESDTHLKQAVDDVTNYNILMKEFPINELLAASTMADVRAALHAVFTHLKKLKLTRYKIKWALALVGALSKDLLGQMLFVLGKKRLFYLSSSENQDVVGSCFEIFNDWETLVTSFREMARVHRRPEEKRVPITVDIAHSVLKDRLQEVSDFRAEYERFREDIHKSLPGGAAKGPNPLDEITNAFNDTKDVALTDVSNEGEKQWRNAERRYNARVDKIEASIVKTLREKLSVSKNANDMFFVFKRYRNLFKRPKVAKACEEYQVKYIERSQGVLDALKEKYKQPYIHSKGLRIDLPPVSAKITWARQIEHQVHLSIDRAAAVLGEAYGFSPAAKKLEDDGKAFLSTINSTRLFDNWVDDAEKRSYDAGGHILTIKERKDEQLSLSVNFSQRHVTLYKEARNLKALGFPIPYNVAMACERARKFHPYASSLTQILDIYEKTSARITPHVRPLAVVLTNKMQRAFVTGFDLHWESEEIATYVKKLAEITVAFEASISLLIQKAHEIEMHEERLVTCPLLEPDLTAILTDIQDTVNVLEKNDFVNLARWVGAIDDRIEAILADRLIDAVHIWVKEFQKCPEEQGNDELLYAEEEGPLASKIITREKMGKAMVTLEHDITAPTMNVIMMDPPIEQARIMWTEQYNMWLGVFCNLERVRVSSSTWKRKGATYTSLLTLMPRDVMMSAYEAIEDMIDRAEEVQEREYSFQDLWDLNTEAVHDDLANNLHHWAKVIQEIHTASVKYDHEATTEDHLGPIIIYSDQMVAKISQRYATVLSTFVSKMAGYLGEGMMTLHATLSNGRQLLEATDVEHCPTEEGVAYVVLVQGFRRKLRHWGTDVKTYRESEGLCVRHEYKFPDDWLFFERLEAEWEAFNELLRRTQKQIATQIPIMRKAILQEDKAIEHSVDSLCEEWEREKPIGGISSTEAHARITNFEKRIKTVRDEYERINIAKEALDLECFDEDKMAKIDTQLDDIKGIWSDLDKVWDPLNELLNSPFGNVNSRKLKNSLEEFQHQLKGLPGRARSTQAFTYVNKLVKHYGHLMPIIEAMRSDPVKKRHWVKFKAKLKTDWDLDHITLANVYEVDLKMYEKDIMEIVRLAQGEMGLESFLKEVATTWGEWDLQLVPFQHRCKVIKGWDDLFNKAMEHLSNLSAMKGSPFYKTFQEEANGWDNRLTMINEVFETWLDVQRRWVYLAGIFTASEDIKVLLPKESAMFTDVDKKFMTLMKKVDKEPGILSVIAMDNLGEGLARMLAHLIKIQKALGEYLERQRASFPRFYFVGDEDLLEIIGNSKDITKVVKHLKKMFAGLSTLMLTDENTMIAGIASAQMEEIPFVEPIEIKKHPKINEWLTLVEDQMRLSLAVILTDAVTELRALWSEATLNVEEYFKWIDKYPDQLVTLAVQVCWTDHTERILGDMKSSGSKDTASLQQLLDKTIVTLNLFADAVLGDLPPNQRKKYEHIMMEMIHERDTIREQMHSGAADPGAYEWLYRMRYYFDPSVEDPEKRLIIRMSEAYFYYGFEYLGIIEKLVHTPLTDRAYTTLTQALHQQMGGAPFGPAGTGKTESVKALGAQLGRFVLVFCCDENFDFQAMGRIFVGLCQVGAWGCFDEFNRLQEKMLSAVSQQIQTMQEALAAHKPEVELLGSMVKLNPNVGVFITMNPGYAGRSALPDNLKQLVRSIAMTVPDKELIGQVMLFSQGFKTAERLAGKVVPLFKLCKEQLSSQSHYDFGLRSLKSVLVSAGNVKRARKKALTEAIALGQKKDVEYTPESLAAEEQDVQIQAVCETLIPKLVAEDIPLLKSLLADVFPNCVLPNPGHKELKREVRRLCGERNLVYSDQWVEKMMQLYQITNLNHGLMLVGPSGGGKSSAWKVLLKALEAVDGREGVSYIIDPKAISVTELYGSMDPNTREWSDGLLTSIVRAVIDNVRGELTKRHWVIFDGEVDPMWVENMNSLLDDNKLLTLPNGERLALPSCVRIIFEVQDLVYASPATVSRCGMVWFPEETVDLPMIYENYLMTLRNEELDFSGEQKHTRMGDTVSTELEVQRQVADLLAPHFEPGALVDKCLVRSSELDHVMDWTRLRVMGSMFSLINRGVWNVHCFNKEHEEYPMSDRQKKKYMERTLVYAIVWGLSGSCKISVREEFGEWMRGICEIDLPPGANNYVLDNEVDIDTGEWSLWTKKVPEVTVTPEEMGTAIIPTLDTVRHVECLFAWLAEHKPLLLCGPPGSGKTMTLFSTLRKATNYECVPINFSSTTTPDLILTTLEQKCKVIKTQDGEVMVPKDGSKWLVMFCDEINLPEPDEYATVIVLAFIRQMVEQNGFWDTEKRTFIKLKRIQFCGACNPPTDPGRTPLSYRFLRWAPLILCDYPAFESLMQIYGTFSRGFLAPFPEAHAHAEPLTRAMVQFYTASQKRFTPDQQQHYIYSPRELTRWVRGIYAAIKNVDFITLNDLVRLWAHEGLRLFQDRLVTPDEVKWTDENLDKVAWDNFPTMGAPAIARPILFSNWLSEGQKRYESVTREGLRAHLHTKLPKFYEEEVDIPIVIFNEVLDHVLRIDRVFNQKQGHVLMIGQSGAGKTLLSRFMAWINNLTVYMIHTSLKYSGEDFDIDLRDVLRRSGAEREKICFIFDESNIKDTGFLERMNTLLANGEIPGLFEGDEYTALMNTCKANSSLDGLMLDSEDELYDWFTAEIIRNLHVVFTMNPAGEGWTMRKATSPALFNRCVLNWYGDWTSDALFQVGLEFTDPLDIKREDYVPPASFPAAFALCPLPPTQHQAIINAMVFVHLSVDRMNKKLSKRQGRVNVVTPRHYLDMLHHYIALFNEVQADLREQQAHLNGGLHKLIETEEEVKGLKVDLAARAIALEEKQKFANEKLRQIIADRQVTGQKKKEASEVADELAPKLKEVMLAKAKANADIEAAEPMVSAAAEAVRAIQKKHLQEMQALNIPPDAVRLCMEAVCTILGSKKIGWNDIRKFSKNAGFLQSVMHYDTAAMQPKLRAKVKRDYVDSPNFTFEKINKASRACGPLCTWVIAQVTYSQIIEDVAPLREELRVLEADASVGTAKKKVIDEKIAVLEDKLAGLEAEYKTLLADIDAMKKEADVTNNKVSRATDLLTSLASESKRWQETAAGFETQMQTVAGDCILGAAFMAYAGFFDQSYRSALNKQWTRQVKNSNILMKDDLSIVNLLSTADQRLEWQANSLPDDDMCTENAIMIKRFKRYPLLIDPSGQATDFVMAQYESKKMIKTSFLDKGFVKHLETGLRFGTPLLVQDVECIDPIVNPILNREIKKQAGRELISLGDQELDFSPFFQIIMSTRNPSHNFPPDLCSRVTFVNFTVTPGSLQAQCLSRVLKVERADIDKKRTSMLRLQGEFRVRLRRLEDDLLSTLSKSEGNILNNDAAIKTLGTLKKETKEVEQQMAETDTIMSEILGVSSQYDPLATACSRVYFALEQLASIHFLYQFSLAFFVQVFEHILMNNSNLDGITDFGQRIDILLRDLFEELYNRVARTILNDDQICLAINLAAIRLDVQKQTIPAPEMDYLLKGAASSTNLSLPEDMFNVVQAKRLGTLATVPAYSSVAQSVSSRVSEWKTFMGAAAPEDAPLEFWNDGAASPALSALRTLVLCRTVRSDRVLSASARFVSSVFGPSFLELPPLDFDRIVFTEVDPTQPLLMCAQPGFDPSSNVDELAVKRSKRCKAVSIGSPEGFELADKGISQAAKTGSWIMLKNVHLAPQWLVSLEKRMLALEPHEEFRLFLTAEINPKIPVTLMRMSRILVFEPPPGVKANLQRSFSLVKAERMNQQPAERARLYFLVAWLHAMVQERLRYRPLGWAQSYEFNDADQRCGYTAIDHWVETVGTGEHVDPANIPYDALRTLLSQSIYGGKIDNVFDSHLLEAFMEALFQARSFEKGVVMIPQDGSKPAIQAPDGGSYEEFLEWVNALPDNQTPLWLGLPNNAEKVLLTTKGNEMISKVAKSQGMDDDDDDDEDTPVPSKAVEEKDSRPAWMKSLHERVLAWSARLPTKITPLKLDSVSVQNPLARCISREVQTGISLLKAIRQDLVDLDLVCKGEIKQTNHIRMLLQTLSKEMIPTTWLKFSVPSTLGPGTFVADFVARCTQLEHLSTSSDYGKNGLHIGKLFVPEAFITASQQFAAASEPSWSLEELVLTCEVKSSNPSPCSFIVEGMNLEGASWDGTCRFSDEMSSNMPAVMLVWRHRSESIDTSNQVNVPVYLNEARDVLLFDLNMECEQGHTSNDYWLRGVATILVDYTKIVD